jgi:hypothetical protein
MKTSPIMPLFTLLSLETIKRIRWDIKTAQRLERLRQGIG